MPKQQYDYKLIDIKGTKYPFKIYDPNKIPPIHRPRNPTKAILIKAGFKRITETKRHK